MFKIGPGLAPLGKESLDDFLQQLPVHPFNRLSERLHNCFLVIFRRVGYDHQGSAGIHNKSGSFAGYGLPPAPASATAVGTV